MIGIDTNILARVCLEDNPREASIAKKLLEQLAANKNLFISSYAVLEMAWVLKMKGKTRSEITEVILTLLDSPGVFVGQREVVSLALEQYRSGKADLGDYFILAEGIVNGSQQLASFDQVLCNDRRECQPPQHYL